MYSGRYEIRHVPATIRERDRIIGETRTPVLSRYERICFEKHLIRTDGKPMADGKLPEDRHIEVKDRAKGQSTITVSRNEVMYGLNQKEKFLLAIVLVDGGERHDGPYYVREPFTQEPDWAVSSINLDLETLLARARRSCEGNTQTE